MVHGAAEAVAATTTDPRDRRGPTEKGVGTFGHMRQIVRQEGLSGLWKGNAARMAKVAPA